MSEGTSFVQRLALQSLARLEQRLSLTVRLCITHLKGAGCALS